MLDNQLFPSPLMMGEDQGEGVLRRKHDPVPPLSRSLPRGEREHNAARSFVPQLVKHHLARPILPVKTSLAVLFVDIADSTTTVLRQPPEVALAMVQRFMSLVTDIALAHCGDVKDYEGDGALLYFGSLAAATRAALAIQSALATGKWTDSLLPQARLSLNVGEVIIGVIGSSQRRSVALIGPAVSLASRLLKHIPPGGIIAPQTAVVQLRRDAPDLAQLFQLQGQCLVPKGFEEECVTAYAVAEGIAPAEDTCPPRNQNFLTVSSACNRSAAESVVLH
ncbi:MAG: adenylate/guanylate cyclase domain-containing protein [Candidatus Binatia bacterium]